MLKDIEDRYSSAFDGLGPGSIQDFKHLIDSIDDFLDLLIDSSNDFGIKLANYAKIKSHVFEFCRFYARWLRKPLTERLKAEITKYWRGQLAGEENKKLMKRWRRSR